MLLWILGSIVVVAWGLALCLTVRAHARRSAYRRHAAELAAHDLDDISDKRANAWRDGMGIFTQDTLNADHAIDQLRREQDDAEKTRRFMSEERRRRERAKRWAWLPWSKYRKWSRHWMEMNLRWLRDDVLRERRRANRFRDALLKGETLTHSDIEAIDSGWVDDATDTLGLAATDPSPADDDHDVDVWMTQDGRGGDLWG